MMFDIGSNIKSSYIRGTQWSIYKFAASRISYFCRPQWPLKLETLFLSRDTVRCASSPQNGCGHSHPKNGQVLVPIILAVLF